MNHFHRLRDEYKDHEPLYTDGSKDDDRVASAAVGKELSVQVRLIDGASIYTVELRAILRALDIVSASGKNKFIIFSDSLSSLQALKGKNVDHPDTLKILQKCYFLRQNNIEVVFAWCPSHIGIQGNSRADTLAKEALNHRISEQRIPFTDLKAKTNSFINTKWQVSWDDLPNNKLHDIRPDLHVKWQYGSRENRREEIVLARCRIGHSHLTHSYLLKGEEAPECIPCAEPLSIKHILIDCVDFSLTRTRFYRANSMKELFDKVSPSKIIGFLKEIGLFYKI